MAARRDRYVAVRQDPSIRRRKQLGADAGLVSAGAGLAAFGVKGATLANKKLRPASKSALAAIGRAEQARKTGKSALSVSDRLAIGLGTTSGVVGIASGANANLIQRAELSKKPVAIKILNSGKVPALPNEVRKPKTKVSKKDIASRRDKRNKAYPAAGYATGAALGAGAAGSYLARWYEVGQNVRAEGARHGAKHAAAGHTASTAEYKTSEAARNAAANNRSYKAALKALDPVARHAAKKGPLKPGTKSHDYYTGNKQLYEEKAKLHAADASKYQSKASAYGKVRDTKTLAAAKHAKRAAFAKPLGSGKVRAALALGAVGAAGLGEASRRANKKGGAARSRQNWWND